MAFRIDLTFDAIEVRLSGMDAVRMYRQTLGMPYAVVARVAIAPRIALEPRIHERKRGTGGADGAASLGDHRVGTFLSEGVDGDQFWAVGASDPDEPLAVVDTEHERFRRLVLQPPQIDEFAATLERQVEMRRR
jgi:hypothetical protein